MILSVEKERFLNWELEMEEEKRLVGVGGCGEGRCLVVEIRVVCNCLRMRRESWDFLIIVGCDEE